MTENGNSPQEKKNYRKANLKGKSFQGEDLSSANFQKAKLKGADFTGADLSGADFSGADLSQAVFADVKADKTNWRGANFDKSVMTNFSTQGSDFQKARFRQIQIENWTDTGSVFQQTSWSKCKIKKSAFVDSDFSQGEFFRGLFSECVLTGCVMKSLKSPAARFEKCELTRCDLESADLLSIVFEDSKIHDCSFSSADMAGMLAVGVQWVDCDFRKAELTTAEFRSNTLSSCKYEKANFRYVSGLDQSVLDEIKAEGGKISRYIVKKLLKFIFTNNIGRVSTVALIAAATIYGINYSKSPSKWSEEKLWSHLQAATDQDRNDDVIMYYKAIIDKLGPGSDRSAEAKIGLARAYTLKSLDEKATVLVEEVLANPKIMPYEKVEALANQANLDIRDNRYDRIVNSAKEIIELTESEESLLSNYSNLLIQLVPAGKFDLVIELIKMALDSDPDNLELRKGMLLLRANSLVNSDMVDKSIEDFKTLEKMSLSTEQLREVLSGLGQAYRNKGDIKKSREYYAKLAEQFPDQVGNVFLAKMDEVQSLRGMDRNEEARKLLEQIINEAPSPGVENRARIALVGMLNDFQEYQEAGQILEVALKSISKDDEFWIEAMISKAQIAKGSGNPEEALDILEEILKEDIDPSFDQWARSLKVEYLSQLDRIDEAIENTKMLIKVSTDSVMRVSNKITLARLYLRKSNYDEALNILDELENMDIDKQMKSEIFTMKMEVFEQGKMPEKAIALADAMDAKSTTPREKLAAKIYKTEFYWNSGDRNKVSDILDEIMKMEKPTDDVPNNMMRLSGIPFDEGLKQKVLDIFLAFEKSYNDDTPNYIKWQNKTTLGHIFRDMNNFNEAKIRYENVYNNSDDRYMFLQAAENLGRLYFDNGMEEKSNQNFQSIMDKWPNSPQAHTTAMIGLAENARRLMKFEKAASLLDEAATKCSDPMDCCRVMSSKAQNLREWGKDTELNELFKMVLEKYSDCWVAQEARESLGLNQQP